MNTSHTLVINKTGAVFNPSYCLLSFASWLHRVMKELQIFSDSAYWTGPVDDVWSSFFGEVVLRHLFSSYAFYSLSLTVC